MYIEQHLAEERGHLTLSFDDLDVFRKKTVHHIRTIVKLLYLEIQIYDLYSYMFSFLFSLKSAALWHGAYITPHTNIYIYHILCICISYTYTHCMIPMLAIYILYVYEYIHIYINEYTAWVYIVGRNVELSRWLRFKLDSHPCN